MLKSLLALMLVCSGVVASALAEESVMVTNNIEYKFLPKSSNNFKTTAYIVQDGLDLSSEQLKQLLPKNEKERSNSAGYRDIIILEDSLSSTHVRWNKWYTHLTIVKNYNQAATIEGNAIVRKDIKHQTIEPEKFNSAIYSALAGVLVTIVSAFFVLMNKGQEEMSGVKKIDENISSTIFIFLLISAFTTAFYTSKFETTTFSFVFCISSLVIINIMFSSSTLRKWVMIRLIVSGLVMMLSVLLLIL